MFSQTELNFTFYLLYNSNSKHMAKINLTNTEGVPAVTICIKCDRRGEPFHVWIHWMCYEYKGNTYAERSKSMLMTC